MLHEMVREKLGEIGLARTGLRVVRFNPQTSTGIVSCFMSSADSVRGIFALTNSFGQMALSVVSFKSSGTIRSLERRLEGKPKAQILMSGGKSRGMKMPVPDRSVPREMMTSATD